MQTRYTLNEANEALRLVRVIARELAERRDELLRLHDFDRAGRRGEEGSPEAPDYARAARLRELEEAADRCREELAQLGLTILREDPLTLHFPGASRVGGSSASRQPVVFCWQEGEDAVGFGHADGEEEHPRRPLRVGRSS